LIRILVVVNDLAALVEKRPQSCSEIAADVGAADLFQLVEQRFALLSGYAFRVCRVAIGPEA
jgi:hypothetical protein